MKSNRTINSIQNKSNWIIEVLINIPFFLQFYILTTSFLYIINKFIYNISNILSNIPTKIIFNFQYWRLITSTFMTTNIFNIILGFLSWYKFACTLENSLGTIKYMIIFLVNSFFIQILYCIFKYISSFITIKTSQKAIIYNKINYEENNGMWGIIICELTLLCLNNPQSQIKLLIFPCSVKAKYYIIILYLLICLFDSFKIDFQIVSGIIYGIIYFYFLKNRIKISDSFVNNIEDKFCFGKLKNIKIFRKNKRNTGNNIIISIDRNVYSPVQITTSSNFNNINSNEFQNNENNNNQTAEPIDLE